MANKGSRVQKILKSARALWDESALISHNELSKVEKFAHFCLMVWRSFTRNRCPVRASALAYATLLALIPMLAVVMSVTSSFLKKEGEEQIDQFIVRLVATVMQPAMLSTNVIATTTNAVIAGTNSETAGTNVAMGAINPATAETNAARARFREALFSRSSELTNENALPAFAKEEQAVKTRKEISRSINEFIQNTRSGTLGVTGSVLLIFVGISMLSRIEETFNDIWGVARGRNWFTRVWLYWGVISLAPLLMIVALGLATGPHLAGTKKLLMTMPLLGHLTFQLLPIVLLCLTLALFYVLMPNTKVSWRAALVGGLVGGVLWHLNNAASVLYVSRVVSNSKIYGSLGLVPVFMIGLYFLWLIMLFGAQVAYAFQNRATYLEEKQVESINQRGREFIALRILTCIGRCFLEGQPPPTDLEMGRELGVPTRLVLQIVQTLCAARLVVEAAGTEPAYLPARPLERITCHDILMAMRAGPGQELGMRNEPSRSEVYGEFHRIEEAERQAASSVTMLALAERGRGRELTG